MTTDAPTATDLEPMTGSNPTELATRRAAEDLRLARLHLRLGMVGAAGAELEDLARREALGVAGLADLAEARWRLGKLEAAAEAAAAHLDAGGDEVTAIVVAAEAAAAAGRPTDSRAMVERAGSLDAPTLDALFAGMPRRAYWPAASAAALSGSAASAPTASAAGAGPASTGPAGAPPPAGRDGGPDQPARAVPGPGEVLAANAGLWDLDATAGATSSSGGASDGRPSGMATPAAPPAWVEPARPRGHADPVEELETAREELVDAPDRGLLRLSLVLRLDPTLAPDVLDAVRLRREPAALVIRGDAQRLLGRHLEAEAEFANAAETIEQEAIAHARRGGHHASREDS